MESLICAASDVSDRSKFKAEELELCLMLNRLIKVENKISEHSANEK